MSRLPDLERMLFDAASALDGQSDAQPGPTEGRSVRRRGWRRAPLLVGVVSLVVASAAVAAVTGLLDTGDPVPSQRPTPLKPAPGTKEFALAGVRVPDPDGGPDWGVGTYAAIPTTRSTGVSKDSAARFGKGVTCVVVGRVQNGQLGVVGRDGVFANDGKFHPLSPAAQASTVCGGRAKDGAFVSFSLLPPIPASGYTGPPGTRIGGCRERVNLDGPTVSPQTRRRLKRVPPCSIAGLRRVVAGFAGPRAATVTLIGARFRRTLRLHAKENGAYLFVIRSASPSPVRLTITDRHGNTCQALPDPNCSALTATP